MKSVKIQLATIKDVQRFIQTVTTFDMDIDLSSGRYVVDAKSIMGIFSLDLMNPIMLTSHSDSDDENAKLFEVLKDYIVE